MSCILSVQIAILVGLLGMQQSNFGLIVHTEKDVKGAPFQAQFEDVISERLGNDVMHQHSLTGVIYRDSDGRRRQEMHLMNRDGASIHLAYIEDPFAKTRYILDTANRVVISRMSLDYLSPSETEHVVSAEAASPQDGISVEVEGLTCYKAVMKMPEGGILEFLYSPTLKVVLLERRVDASREKTFRLFNIRRGEVNRDLFTVPTDYK